MPNKPNPNDIIWDESDIAWDQPELPPSPPEANKQEKAAFDFTLSVQNLGEGAWGKLKSLVKPETYMGLLELVNTGGQLMMPGISGIEPYEKLAQMGSSIVSDYIEKYGSWDKVKSTFQNTPIEPILDASMILTGGGTAVAGKAGWLGKIGKVAQGAGMATDPFNVLTAAPKGISWLAKPFLKKESLRMYLSGVPISKKLDIEDIKRAAQTGLDEGFITTEKSLRELKSDMDHLRNGINSEIDIGTKRGDFVNTWKAVDEIDNMAQKYSNRLGRDPELFKMLDDIKQTMVEIHGEKIPVKLAQELKMDTQSFLKGSYDKLSATRQEAEKYATAGVRKQLEDMYPKLKELNPKMQEYVWLKEAINKEVKNALERPILPGIGFFNVIKNKTIDSPLVKQRIAQALSKTNKVKLFSPTTTLARETLYQLEDIPKKQEADIP